MKCKAVYIGAQGDTGYTCGKSYKIKVKMHKNCITVESKKSIIRAYTTFSNFLKDWSFEDDNSVEP